MHNIISPIPANQPASQRATPSLGNNEKEEGRVEGRMEGRKDVPSAEAGLSSTAQKIQVQKSHAGLASASSSGERAQSAFAASTSQSARMRWTSRPVRMLMTMPRTTLGRKRRAAARTWRCWTSWKLPEGEVGVSKLK